MTSSHSISELHQVIRRIEAKNSFRRAPGRPASLEELLGGAVEQTEHGPVLVVRRRFGLDHCHGEAALARSGEIEIPLLQLLARAAAEVPAGKRLLFLDTETTGLAGGTGTYVFLVGAGFFDGDGFEVRQYFMRDLDEEAALLSALEALFRDFDGFVTYNGTGFDLPLLETRFVLARRRWPGDRFHLDLLTPARRLWSARLSDCRLGTLEQHVLGFRRADDLPGALIPSVYFDFLRRRRPGELPRVFEHNRHDVLSLAALTGWVAAAVAQAPAPDLHPDELVGLGRLWETVDADRGLACYRMALELGLASPRRERVMLWVAHREKRRARWSEAQSLWEAVMRSEQGFDPRPWEEVAKLHEHRRRDVAAALAVVDDAIARARAHRAPPRVVDALEHRLGRLTRRLERAMAPGQPAPPG